SQVNGADVSYSYIVKYSGGSGRGDTLPMLIALHGNGDTTKGFYKTALDEYTTSARIVLIKAPIPYGRGSAWPIAPDIVPYGDALSQVVEKLTNKYPTTGKPILLGFSGGGIMAYYQAVQHGDDYSHIFPISGRLVKQDLGNQVAQPSSSVHAFHGKSDSVVSFSGGKKAVSVLKSKGVTIQFTEFDGGHHGVFVEMKTEITQSVEEKLEALY
ncbi:MAG: alpha/beta hydrolase, partial [Methylophagaceae bacterium]